MDKTTFFRWFRQTASNLGVPDIGLKYMRPGETGKELGRYEPGSNSISIDERILANDSTAIQAALHEFAHAIVYKKTNGGLFERRENKIAYDPNNPLAMNALKKLEFKGGHGGEWRNIATNLGVDVNTYVDKPEDNTAFGQLRKGLGYKRH